MKLSTSLTAAFSLAVAAHAQAQTQTYAIEMSHSTIAFEVGFVYSPVRGQFDRYAGTISYDPANVTKSSVRVSIETGSIDTGSDHRDEHLRSSDFFDVARFPSMTFDSRSVALSKAGFVLKGPLSLHGVTRDVSILFTRLRPRPTRDMAHGTEVVNFRGMTRLSRKDFEIKGGSAFNPWFDEIRNRAMSDSIDVTLDIQAWRKLAQQ